MSRIVDELLHDVGCGGFVTAYRGSGYELLGAGQLLDKIVRP